MIATAQKEQIRLTQGSFTPSQTADMLTGLIDQKINFYKIMRWSSSVNDENVDTSWISDKINELQAEKEKVKSLVNEARSYGKRVSVKGSFEILLED